MEYLREVLTTSQGVPLPLIVALVVSAIVGIAVLVFALLKNDGSSLTLYSSTSPSSSSPPSHALPLGQRRPSEPSSPESTLVKPDHYLAGKTITMLSKRPHDGEGTLQRQKYTSKIPKCSCHLLSRPSMKRRD